MFRLHTGCGGFWVTRIINSKADWKRKKASASFLKKKKQKTFAYCGLWHLPGQRPPEQKFFCFFFFKKRSAYFLLYL